MTSIHTLKDSELRAEEEAVTHSDLLPSFTVPPQPDSPCEIFVFLFVLDNFWGLLNL